MKLKGFVALITGASSGMGYEMAKTLLSQDATVIIGARKSSKLNKAYEQLSSAGYDVHAVPLDVRDETSVGTGQSCLCLYKYQYHDAEGAIPLWSLQSRCRGNDGHHGRGTPRGGHGWRGCKSFFQQHNMPILPPTIMNEVILFLASSEAKGITGEKIIAKDFETWLNNRGLAFSGKHLSFSNSSSEPLIR